MPQHSTFVFINEQPTKFFAKYIYAACYTQVLQLVIKLWYWRTMSINPLGPGCQCAWYNYFHMSRTGKNNKSVSCSIWYRS